MRNVLWQLTTIQTTIMYSQGTTYNSKHYGRNFILPSKTATYDYLLQPHMHKVRSHAHISDTGEKTRLLSNTDNRILYWCYQNKPFEKFRHRGYSKRVLRDIKSMTHSKRPLVVHKLNHKRLIERPILFVTTFPEYDPPINKVLCTRRQNIYEQKSSLPTPKCTIHSL